MRSSVQNPSFQPNILRSPEPNVSTRRPASIDRYGIQSGTEVPFGDPQARYSISYVPGMSEHVVNTGKTLPEAQLKVVLLACEVERLNTLNYNLVKENEILKAQTKKSEREADLETKIAIVLAENEKLNQIVEELHTVYARERESLSNEEYERRIAELLQDLDEWKNKYNKLGSETRDNRSRIEIEQLEQERDALKEQLGRQGRDLEALRNRLSSIVQTGPADTRLLQEQITNLKIENEKLKSELDTMKLQFGNADLLQQRLNQYDSKLRVLLSENEKLNDLIVEQNKQIKALQKTREETIVITRGEEEKVKNAGANQANQQHLIERLAGDNKELSATLAQLKDKLTIMARDNERLNDLVDELRNEHNNLRRQIGDTSRINQLTVQINNLLEENRRLNDAVNEKMRSFEESRARVLALQAELEQLRTENDRLRRQLADTTGGNVRVDQLTIQLNNLLEENKKLNDLLLLRTREIEGLNSRIRELEHGSGNLAVYREKLSLITTENERLNAYNAELRSEIDRLKLSSGDSVRIGQLNDTLLERTREIDRLRIRISELEASSATINELRSRLNLLSTDNETLRKQLSESGQGNARLEQLKVQVSSLLSENQRLNEALLAKSAEIDELRRSHSGAEASQGRVSYLTTENERLTIVITERLREIDSLKARLASLESSSFQINSLEERIRSLNGERDRLNITLTERLREIDQLRLRISELQGGSTVIDDLRARIVLLSADNERLTNQFNDRLRESDTLRIRISELQGSSSVIDDLKARLVLLSAENERLFGSVSEAETLRRRIYELESLGASASNLEIQKLLQDRDALKAQLTVALAERDRFSILLSEKTRELDLVRTQTIGRTESPERITRAALPSENDETIKSLESRNKFLDMEQARLISLLADRDHEIETLKQRINQLNLLVAENDRLNLLVIERTREIDSLRRHTPETGLLESEKTKLEADYRLLLERQTSDLTLRFEGEKQALLQRVQELQGRLEVLAADNDRISRLVSEHSLTIESWKLRYEQLEKQKDAEIENIRLTSRASPIRPAEEGNLSDKVDYLTSEIERLQEHLNGTLKELEGWRKKYTELEIVRAQELDELRLQFGLVKRNQVETKEVASKFAAERIAYETLVAQLQAKITDYEKQLQLVSAESERFMRLSTSRIEEVEGQKRRQHELKMSQSLELAQLRQQIEVFKANATDVKQLAIKYSADKAADQSQIKQLKQVNENLKAEVDKLYELIDQRKSDFEVLNKQNQELLVQHERLTHQMFESGKTTTESSERFELISKEVETLKSARDEFKSQAERNSVELTRRNKDLVDKIQELDVLKMKYEEGLANYQALNTKLFDKLTNAQ